MTPRIANLRRQSLDAQPAVSAERALLVTEYYQSEAGRQLSPALQRAGAFAHIMANKQIWIGEGELIVGERGPLPKATPTYPEVCLHTLENLEILDRRERTPYRVDDATRSAHAQTIIPFWQGRTMRERIFEHMHADWRTAYAAGMFTEFQEQRSPGHTVLGGRLFGEGFEDILKRIAQIRDGLDFVDDPQALDKLEALRAMTVCAEAVICWAQRYAHRLESEAGQCADTARRAELARMATICRKVPAQAPETFWEALQHYWFIHVGVITELNPWDAFNPGRLDQHLYPFYRRDIASGRLTPDQARELVKGFGI